jgi:hypothetical protein
LSDATNILAAQLLRNSPPSTCRTWPVT